MFQATHNLIDSVTVTNGNSVRDTALTAIACIPIIPGGIFMLFRYIGKVKVEINKYYNHRRFAQSIKEQYGINVFRRRGLFGIF